MQQTFAKKARRRQWDPPKVPKNPVGDSHSAGLAARHVGPALPAPGQPHDTRKDSEPRHDHSEVSSRVAHDHGPLLEDIDVPVRLPRTSQHEEEQSGEPMDNTVHSSRAGAGCVGVTFPSSAEHIAIQALTQLAKPGGGSVDSILEKALQLTSTGRNTVPDIGQPTALTQQEKPIPSAGPVDSILEKALQLTSTGRNTFSEIDHDTSPNISIRVRAANESVAALNAGPLTKPNAFDREFWIRSKELAFSTQYLTAANLTVMSTWRHTTWTHGDDGEFLLPAAVIQMSSPAPSSPLSDISSEHDTAPEILDLVKASDLAQAELDKFRSTSHRAGSRSEQRLIEAVEGAKEALDQAQKGLQDAPSSVTEAGEPVQNSLDHAPKTGPTSLTTGPASASSGQKPKDGLQRLVAMRTKGATPKPKGRAVPKTLKLQTGHTTKRKRALAEKLRQLGNPADGDLIQETTGNLGKSDPNIKPTGKRVHWGDEMNALEQLNSLKRPHATILESRPRLRVEDTPYRERKEKEEVEFRAKRAKKLEASTSTEPGGFIDLDAGYSDEDKATASNRELDQCSMEEGDPYNFNSLNTRKSKMEEGGPYDFNSLNTFNSPGIDPALVSMEPQFNNKARKPSYSGFGTTPGFQYRQDSLFGLPPYPMASWTQWNQAGNSEQGQGSEQMYGSLLSGGAANGEQGQGSEQMYGSLLSGGAANSEQGQGNQQVHETLLAGGAANSEQGQGGQQMHGILPSGGAANSEQDAQPAHGIQAGFWGYGESGLSTVFALQTANKAKATSKPCSQEGLQTASKAKVASRRTEPCPREGLQTANKAKAASKCTEFFPREALQTANKAKAASKCTEFFPREALQTANKAKANKAKAASKCTEFFPREALQTANKAKAASRCTEFCPWEGLQTANKAKAASKCMEFFPREGLQMANKTKYAAQVAALVAVKLESSALLSIETKGTQQKKPKTVKAPKREDSGNNSPGEEFDFEKAEEGDDDDDDDDDDEGGMKIPGRHQRGARGNGLRAARGGKIGDLVKNWITLSPEQRREKSMAAQQALLESWEVQQQTGTCKGFTQAVGPYIRDIQELCPDAGSTSFQIFREIHKTSTGNYQCGHHHGHHGPKQILADGNLKNKWTIVGQPRPYQLKKTKDDVVAVMPGYFHCGCDEKEVAIDFFIWKMCFEITRDVERKDETISVTEAMGSQRLDPRTRAFFCDLLAKQGITFDTIYTNGASRADWKMTMLAKQVEVVASRLDKATLAAGHIDPTEPGQSLVVVPMAALLPEVRRYIEDAKASGRARLLYQDTTNQGKGKGKDMARKGGMNH
ncbi:hypothetical protein FB451DRAFT_1563278 [Mycena latifolia]|nr:hypothetical protein FB451DRAFT_1563278 [Mycena latifolia]